MILFANKANHLLKVSRKKYRIKWPWFWPISTLCWNCMILELSIKNYRISAIDMNVWHTTSPNNGFPSYFHSFFCVTDNLELSSLASVRKFHLFWLIGTYFCSIVIRFFFSSVLTSMTHICCQSKNCKLE